MDVNSIEHKKTDKTIGKIGSLSFITGVIVSLFMGVIMPGNMNVVVASLLMTLGLVVGLLNVSQKESTNFLLATAVLVIVSGFGSSLLSRVEFFGPFIVSTLSSLMIFVIPATIIVALKVIFAAAHKKA